MLYQEFSEESLAHHGILGQKWGIRRFQKLDGTRIKKGIEAMAYSIGAQLNPREVPYKIKRLLNTPNESTKHLANAIQNESKISGTLVKNKKAMQAIESIGIEKHKEAVYDLNDTDVKRLQKYTDSARYSRSINGFLAIKDPKEYEKQANQLKETLNKGRINDTILYRSCNFKFSIDGLTKKITDENIEEAKKQFDTMSKNFSGKSRSENRVWSTSTSPLFAIDTWREVNPTAAKTYNTYFIINAKNCPGVLADGKSTSGRKLVNTQSNQEGILAPNKLTYRKLAYDSERDMFAITIDAEE